jgi:hypothetical protein
VLSVHAVRYLRERWIGIVTVTTVGGHGGSGRDCRHEVAT